MAQTTATAMQVAVKTVDGNQRERLTPVPLVDISYLRGAAVVRVGLAQPGMLEDDGSSGLVETAANADEMYDGTTKDDSLFVHPAFPREAGPMIRYASNIAAVFGPLVKYTMNEPKYGSAVFPEPEDDRPIGFVEESDLFGILLSESERYVPFAAQEARRGSAAAHDPTLVMSDSEVSASGATGIWSIAGRV